jgi:hypothetical protein
MTAGLLPARLSNQGLARAAFRRAEEVVAWFGAVQAQDYLGALWGIGQRLRRATEAEVEAAEARRTIVRTWPMRGTLHFVAAADARWMTRLLAPRVMARHAARWKRDFGVDGALVARADDILTRALEGGKRLARDELYAVLESRRIRTGASRGLHLLLCLAMRGRLCLAGRVGKQHSFALLDDWIPGARELDRDAALVELATRYFTAHGPATPGDFAWWSGITAADARVAIDGARTGLAKDTIDGVTYWSGAARRARSAGTKTPHVRLLPAYDEYTVGYADRSPLLERGSRLSARGMGLLSPVVLVDGKIVGTWKRTISGGSVRVEARLARKLARDEGVAMDAAVADYGRFLGLEAHRGPIR